MTDDRRSSNPAGVPGQPGGGRGKLLSSSNPPGAAAGKSGSGLAGFSVSRGGRGFSALGADSPIVKISSAVFLAAAVFLELVSPALALRSASPALGVVDVAGRSGSGLARSGAGRSPATSLDLPVSSPAAALDSIARVGDAAGMANNYPGSKRGSGVRETLINLMPPHSVFIEPFFGSGAVMRAKRPAALNIGVDLDPAAPGLAWVDEQGPSPAAISGGAGLRPEFRGACLDGVEFLKVYPFSGAELVYCDPPYLLSTRRGDRRLYRCEFTDADHVNFLRVARGLNCRVMISGYWSQLYVDMLAGWNSIRYTGMVHTGKRTTEWVWFNFPRPVALHDTRFLGDGYRERERLGRLARRWVARLDRMAPADRTAVLSAIVGHVENAGGGQPLASGVYDIGGGGVLRVDRPSLKPAATQGETKGGRA